MSSQLSAELNRAQQDLARMWETLREQAAAHICKQQHAEQHLNDLKQQLASSQADNKQLSADAVKLQEAAATAQRQLDASLDAECERARSQQAGLRQDIEALVLRRQEVQDIADQRQMQNESLQQQVELNTGAEDSLTEKLVASRDDARALREDQQQLQQQLRKAASAGQLAQQNLLACRTEAAKLPALLKSNEALSARHEKLVADKAALQQRCDTSQELLNAKDKSSAAERQPKTRARQSIALLQEELDSMRALQDVTQSELDMLVRSVEHAQKVLQADEPGTRSLEDRHRALCAAMRQTAYKLPANLRAQQLMNAASVDLT